MVLAAATVIVVPSTENIPVIKEDSTGANHHPPAAVNITKMLSFGLVSIKRSEAKEDGVWVNDMWCYVSVFNGIVYVLQKMVFVF
jgi:hypothetical protein